MADAVKMSQDQLTKLLKQLDSQGISLNDIQKGLKTLRDKGEIKARGRGKMPSDDPLRVEIKGFLTSKDFAPTMAKIVDATKESTSLLVQLSDMYAVNFIKKVKRVKKEKKADTPEAQKAKESEFAEPAIA
jgi:hypothetical protein